jgi:RHS repeat-associated protein
MSISKNFTTTPTNKYKYNGKEEQETPGRWLDYGARMYDAQIGRWHVVDPMSDKYPSTSAYMYCSGNPVILIDPNGLDEWEINKQGEVVGDPSKNERLKTTEHDAFYKVDENGNRTGESISFKYETVRDHNQPIVNNEKVDIFRIKGDENAKNLFEFFANKTDVEWTHAKIGAENSGSNIVGTSHSELNTSIGHYLREYNYTLREVNHNHPNGNPLPSGIKEYEESGKKTRDLYGAELYITKHPNIKLNIYTTKFGYSLYNDKGTLDPRIKKVDGHWTITQ